MRQIIAIMASGAMTIILFGCICLILALLTCLLEPSETRELIELGFGLLVLLGMAGTGLLALATLLQERRRK